jgi:hypothetical protein
MILGRDVRIGGTGCPGSFRVTNNRFLPSLVALRTEPEGRANIEYLDMTLKNPALTLEVWEDFYAPKGGVTKLIVLYQGNTVSFRAKPYIR